LKRYVLCYFIYRPNNINSIIRSIKKITSLDIIIVERRANRYIFGDKIILDCGPQEFLWLVDNAEMVFTTSFHGAAMSLIFEKKLKVINNPYSPDRIDNLVNLLGCQNIISSPIRDIYESNISHDYSEIIKKEREKSLKYLKESLE